MNWTKATTMMMRKNDQTHQQQIEAEEPNFGGPPDRISMSFMHNYLYYCPNPGELFIVLFYIENNYVTEIAIKP